MSKRMYHPCHKLSVPSAKLFWCRHCMQMFEDAITRWKHSKKCHASPGYKPKDQDAKVVQLYVKPDTVSYTSNIVPGQAVYYKPHVKKTSTDLKCVICGTKFYSLYDMRMHVREPCQRSENNSVASTQFNSEEDVEESPYLKIRRVESDKEDKLNTSTALSVLAEASKHVESLSHGEVVIEQVIEEEVPQVIENFPGTTVYGAVFEGEAAPYIDYQPVQEVVIAYPKPQVKPELGTVVVALQSEEGHQISQDSLDQETIQECLKETAQTLPAGQILQLQFEGSEKSLLFIVGYQGAIWPLREESRVPDNQEQATNAVLQHLNPLISLEKLQSPVKQESLANSAASNSALTIQLNSEELNWQVLTSVLEGNSISSTSHPSGIIVQSTEPVCLLTSQNQTSYTVDKDKNQVQHFASVIENSSQKPLPPRHLPTCGAQHSYQLPQVACSSGAQETSGEVENKADLRSQSVVTSSDIHILPHSVNVERPNLQEIIRDSVSGKYILNQAAGENSVARLAQPNFAKHESQDKINNLNLLSVGKRLESTRYTEDNIVPVFDQASLPTQIVQQNPVKSRTDVSNPHIVKVLVETQTGTEEKKTVAVSVEVSDK